MPGGSRPTPRACPLAPRRAPRCIYEANLHQGPETLRAFLNDFPKGADLHVHLSGAVYAETFIRDAGEDGLCVDKTALSFAKPPCRGNLIPATSSPATSTGRLRPLRQADRLVLAAQLCAYAGLERTRPVFCHF